MSEKSPYSWLCYLLISSCLHFMGPANLCGHPWSVHSLMRHHVRTLWPFPWNFWRWRGRSLGVTYGRKRDSNFAESFNTTCVMIVQWDRQQRHTSSLRISVDRSEEDLPHSRVKWRLFSTIKSCNAPRWLPRSLTERYHHLITILAYAVFPCIQILATKHSSME